MNSTIKTVCAALSIALILTAMTGLNIVSAQSPVDYDSDDDGLIEVEWLEQLNAVRWDLDGDGFVDEGSNAGAYSVAFLDAAKGMGCAEGCRGYELTRNLDFRSAGSYASGAVNDKWTSGNGWLPIAPVFEDDEAFRTTFDGNGHTITNLYIDRRGESQPVVIGLFGYVGFRSGEISKIGLINIDVKGEHTVGGLVGFNDGSIIDSYASGSASGGEGVGGLVGEGGNITSSHASVSVIGNRYVGGLIGEGNNITSSYATGSVVGKERVGGLVGVGGDITSSYATGNVSGGSDVGGLAGIGYRITSSYATGSVSGEWNLGGLVGEGGESITHSYATGDVSGDQNIGGLVGNCREFLGISFSYATGNVSGEYNVGGLVGNFFEGSIISSYSIGSVSGTGAAGGLVGFNNGKISYSYSISKVRHVGTEQNTSLAGFLGINYEAGGVSASYWNTETTEQSIGVGEGNDNGVRGKTTSELQKPTDYTDIYAEWLTDIDNADEDYDETTGVDDFWDFGTSSQYPELKADLDNSGHASWWEFGSQHGRPQPTATPTPIAADTPTPTSTPTVTRTPTITPTPTQTATPTNTPIPTETPTATPSPTMTPIPTDTPVPTATATHTAEPTDTTVPSNTPEPTKTAVPPTQTPVIIVVTATPSADAPAAGGCNSVGAGPVGTAAANLLFVVAPLGIIGGVRYRRRKMGSTRYE